MYLYNSEQLQLFTLHSTQLLFMKLFYVFLFLLVTNPLFSQNISNVQVKPSKEKITVTYELSGRMSSDYHVVLLYSTEGGKKDSFKEAKHVEGAVGKKIKPQVEEQTITWNVLDELEQLSSKNMVFRVQADVVENENIRKFTLPISASTLGGGLLATGFAIESKAKAKYDTYVQVKDESDEFYRNLYEPDTEGLRDRYYDEANSQHHTAIISKLIGGIVLAGGAAWMVKNILNNKKIEKEHSTLLLKPSLHLFVNEKNTMYPQFGLTLQF